MNAHLLADEIGHWRRSDAQVLASAEGVDRDCGLVPVRDGGDDVLRTQRRVAAKENARRARLESQRIDRRQPVAVEASTPAIAFDPGEGVLLADRDQARRRRVCAHRVRRSERAGGGRARPFRASTFSKLTPVSLPDSCVKAFGTRKLRISTPSWIASSFSQGDAFISAKPERTTTLTVLAAEAPRGAAAVHRGIAAAQHDDALADRVGMAEEDARKPFDADMDVRGRLATAGHVEVAAVRRAAADEDRVEPFADQRLQAGDPAGGDEGRRRSIARSRLPRRSPRRAGGIWGSGCASFRRRFASASNTTTS